LTQAAEKIRREIETHGSIPFARFMELALFCPVCGYYEAEKDRIGKRGDFYTSVSVGNLFGELLAFQFAEWLQELRSADCRVRIVEAGAHDAQLARDILDWMQRQRPRLFGELEYCIIEPSARRQQWQAETLRSFAGKTRWISQWSDCKRGPQFTHVVGIIFSNELLDAMPVHRYAWDAGEKTWFEWGVTVRQGNFVWQRMPPADDCPSFVSGLPQELLDVLPDGFVLEHSPAAETWWREAAEHLRAGKLLALDYGLTTEEFLAPERSRGTARAYLRHHAVGNLLANPGEQDITAHVNFSAVQSTGELAGLSTIGFMSQAKFLTGIVERVLREPNQFGDWNAARSRQFQTLTHPDHLGHAFRVLIQSR
jgi:SAM-dependent MidA family methyltransferase